MANKPALPFIPRDAIAKEIREIGDQLHNLSHWLDEDAALLMERNIAILRHRLSNYSPFVEQAYELYLIATDDLVHLLVGSKLTLVDSIKAQAKITATGSFTLEALDALLVEPNLSNMEVVHSRLLHFVHSIRGFETNNGYVISKEISTDEALDNLLAIILMNSILLQV